MVLNVDIKKRVATYQESDELPICGNTGDTVKFTFDEEWSEHETKTARFIWGGKYEDVEFTGDTCEVPVVTNSQVLIVGVYAGELPEDGFMLSSTNVSIRYRLSTRCGNVTPNDVTAHYTNLAKGYAEEAKEAAKSGFYKIGVIKDKCYDSATDEGTLFGGSVNWHNVNENSGKVQIIGASDSDIYQGYQSPEYNNIYELLTKSKFLTLFVEGAEASFGYDHAANVEVVDGLLPLMIFESFQDDEQGVVTMVAERLKNQTKTCFVEVFTPNNTFLVIYLSPFMVGALKYLADDGSTAGLVFTCYNGGAEEYTNCVSLE